MRPWYVQAEQTPIPQLSFVVLAYGDQVVRARTLEGALKLAFPNANVDFTTTVGPLTPLGGADTGQTPAAGSGSTDNGSPSTGSGSTGSTTAPAQTATVQELLDQANQLYTEAKAALKTDPPDFATYDAKIAKAFELVTQAEQLSGGTPPAPDRHHRLRRHRHDREHVAGRAGAVGRAAGGRSDGPGRVRWFRCRCGGCG